MNITKVVVQPLTGSSGGRLLAFANLIVDDQYVVNGLRIYRNRNGELEVQYPSLHAPKQYKRLGCRTLYAVVPMNEAAHARIKQTVLAAYRTCCKAPDFSYGERQDSKADNESAGTASL